ncbi:hypothetical protein ABIA39_002757 [Nocardia sp. GAS34]|uniref:hypothetical protein n=1 Tax=unclassified Nocardia TaxID=2637762 RepID=UPI003D1B1D33
MNVEKLRTVEDWVALYRHEFALPVTERGGFVMLPITGSIGVVHLPVLRAERVRTALADQGVSVPMLARQIRWSFVVTPDERPANRVVDVLNRLDIGIPGIGSAVMLPTGLGRWTREGCHWIVPPTRTMPVRAGAGRGAYPREAPGATLPPLSVVITTALAVGGGED